MENETRPTLSEVEPRHYFRIKDGSVVKSLADLVIKLELMDDETFSHHVGKDRNDFASWIADIIKDRELADKLKDVKTKKKIIEFIEERIHELVKLQRNLNIMQSSSPIKPKQQLPKGMDSTLKEYIYGLVIGIIIGVLIGLLL